MKRKKAVTLTTAALALTMAVCGSSTAIAASELTAESKPATQYTIDANQEVYAVNLNCLQKTISNKNIA